MRKSLKGYPMKTDTIKRTVLRVTLKITNQKDSNSLEKERQKSKDHFARIKALSPQSHLLMATFWLPLFWLELIVLSGGFLKILMIAMTFSAVYVSYSISTYHHQPFHQRLRTTPLIQVALLCSLALLVTATIVAITVQAYLTANGLSLDDAPSSVGYEIVFIYYWYVLYPPFYLIVLHNKKRIK